MRVRSLLVLGIVLLFGTARFAQDYAKVEIPLDYSYMRFNRRIANIISGLSRTAGVAGVAVYLNHWLGIQGDFQGYGSFNRTFVFLQPLIARAPQVCNVKASGNLFTYNAGPVLKYRTEHLSPS